MTETRTEPAAAQRAYAATKDRILAGLLPAGSLLSEGEIAHELALSRTPVREAFLRLEAEQLLQLIPKRGAVVVAVPATEAVDILDVRRALETAAVRRLAATPDDLTGLVGELAALVEQQARAARDRDVVRFAELDERFHHAVVTAAGNAIATRLYATLADRQRRMTVGAVGPRPERLADLVAQHRGLLTAIADRDLPAFTAALEDHLDSTHNAFHSR